MSLSKSGTGGEEILKTLKRQSFVAFGTGWDFNENRGQTEPFREHGIFTLVMTMWGNGLSRLRGG